MFGREVTYGTAEADICIGRFFAVAGRRDEKEMF